MPAANNAAETAKPEIAGHRNDRFRLSNELRRQAISGPTPVSSSRNIAMGMFTRLKNGLSTLIFSPITASVITGNNVPHRIAKQLASRIRLLNMKLDSRERTLSICDSLFRYSRRLRIRYTVREILMAMNATKYFPMGPSENACTDCTIPLRVRNVPKMHRKKVEETSTMFQTFIIPFFSCIMTECRKAVAVIQGSSEAFSTGSHPQYPPHPKTAYAQPAPRRTPVVWNIQVTSVQRRVVWIQASPRCLVI